MRCETVKVVNPEDKSGGFMIINKSDFDADQASKKPKHKLHDANDEDPEDQDPVPARTRNPSGTFSEPTPTDVRYGGDTNATEFENNHGAFIGKSAAEMRAERDMDDRPGGLKPEVHEAVEEAEAARQDAQAKAEAAKHKRSLPRKLPKKAAKSGTKAKEE